MFNENGIEIICDDFITTDLVKNKSVDLIITSPPYNVDINYGKHKDGTSYEEYLEFTYKWLKRAYQVSKNSGRLCLNIPLDKNKGGQQSVYADFVRIAKKAGWKYHTTVIWNEQNISRRTAWGSFKSASAPYIIAPVEMIVILYKKIWKKEHSGESDISKEDFMNWTNGVWTFNGESKKRIGHPAPFPLELPKRCIQMFSYIGDTILDPFLGSGTTLVTCSMFKRKGIGVDIDKTYCDLAIQRVSKVSNQLF